METKAKDERRKYSAIAETALRLFLENGYEATSMRMIASDVGCEPGLIYYYFKNKDEAFEQAFERLFDSFDNISKTASSYHREPYAVLYPILHRFSVDFARFQAEYGIKLHWTVRGAVKERALAKLYSSIYEAICRLKIYGTIAPTDTQAAAEFIAYGIGGAILTGNMSDSHAVNLARCASDILRPIEGQVCAFVPFPAKSANGFTEFLHSLGNKDTYNSIAERIDAREVITVGNGERIIGAAIFSRTRGSVDFLAVLPEYRRLGIGTRLVSSVIAEFSPEDIITAAFNEDRTDATALYAGLGFKQSRAIAPYGSPIICMTLRIENDR